ncbi:MAG: FkbM family methyltransferase [Chitinophagaceae bacterium]|nr:FkbM family methyltransferase [Chitinophagaceae bacterium]
MQDKSLFKNLWRGIKGRIAGLFYNPYKKAGLNWVTVKYYKHLAPGKLRQHKLFNKTVFFKNPAEFLHGIDEIFIQELYKQTLPEQSLILDCGANIGLSVIYLKRKYPDAKVIAFEPDDENFSLLKKNVASCELKDVSLVNKAVWTENTVLNFISEGTMSSKIDNSQESGTGNKIEAINLGDFLDKKIDFLKIDIEGAEYAVLKSAGAKLNMVTNLFLEYHGKYTEIAQLTDLLSILTKSGFTYYIKEAAEIYPTPFLRTNKNRSEYDVQLNIFCFRV